MNMNQLVNMFTRIVARRAMNWGINKGIKSMSRPKAKPTATPGQPQPDIKSNGMAEKMRVLTRLTRR